MAFTWTPIDVGDVIKKAHVIELRDNIDYISDNLACVTDKDSVHSSYDSSYKSGYNTTVDNYDKGTYKSDHKTGNYWGHEATIYSNNDINEYGTHDESALSAPDKGTYNGGYYVDCSGYNSPV